MSLSVALIRKLERVAPEIRDVLLTLVEEVERNREESVTKREFNELKEVVSDLAKGQAQLATTVAELAEAQKRTELKVEELAQAQRVTEQRLGELAKAQAQMTQELRRQSRGLKNNREQIGGLSRSVAYALENEAFRKLPAFLAARHGIEVRERIVRAEVAGEEINLLAKATRDDRDVVLVGESVLRLDDLAKLRKIRKKLEALQPLFESPIVPIIVTHFARPKVLEKAQAAGMIVVQSFEWGP